jgi:hypothetical protein
MATSKQQPISTTTADATLGYRTPAEVRASMEGITMLQAA